MIQTVNCKMHLVKLNSGSGTLLIMRILHDEQTSLDKKTLFEETRKHGVGQSAFKTSITILQELGLIEEKEERFHIRGTISKMQYLTDKGKKVAEKVAEIDGLLM